MTRRRKGGSDSHFYYKWLDKALCDLQCARLLLTYGGDAYNIAFHCQQAIEKALKGYLLYRTGKHFDGHNHDLPVPSGHSTRPGRILGVPR